MYKRVILSLFAMSSVSGLASQDLTLPGERWLAAATGYICEDARDVLVEAPEPFAQFDVKFETLTTDYSLDNALLKATFMENGEECRYSALLFADNAAYTSEIVESVAYSIKAGTDCSKGQAKLDEALSFNDYLYWGRPHHLTFMVETEDAVRLCGKDATHVGVDFVLKGRI
ncbi:hypothetical protein [Pseudobacteriovorax antillogorgiicola]|uniref:Uncharacterized protein n=1 Tax=Pseudobacteriovorax antillogorgiicola TaxID=1513793 RepID=A0A1Y6CIL9_9BACT|nr:hypothetical protein [Pseudobacteriovorax antillogorgiicola]TCS48293.1 hypothetical protein EDD56_11873 [Pseudobacteriovorax antillogorgiicola]SMF56860.1 hypothetical protein SAMN06296036_11868 [Pseudobacteriovorax antillogorgiicola]